MLSCRGHLEHYVHSQEQRSLRVRCLLRQLPSHRLVPLSAAGEILSQHPEARALLLQLLPLPLRPLRRALVWRLRVQLPLLLLPPLALPVPLQFRDSNPMMMTM